MGKNHHFDDPRAVIDTAMLEGYNRLQVVSKADVISIKDANGEALSENSAVSVQLKGNAKAETLLTNEKGQVILSGEAKDVSKLSFEADGVKAEITDLASKLSGKHQMSVLDVSNEAIPNFANQESASEYKLDADVSVPLLDILQGDKQSILKESAISGSTSVAGKEAHYEVYESVYSVDDSYKRIAEMSQGLDDKLSH